MYFNIIKCIKLYLEPIRLKYRTVDMSGCLVLIITWCHQGSTWRRSSPTVDGPHRALTAASSRQCGITSRDKSIWDRRTSSTLRYSEETAQQVRKCTKQKCCCFTCVVISQLIKHMYVRLYFKVVSIYFECLLEPHKDQWKKYNRGPWTEGRSLTHLISPPMQSKEDEAACFPCDAFMLSFPYETFLLLSI